LSHNGNASAQADSGEQDRDAPETPEAMAEARFPPLPRHAPAPQRERHAAHRVTYREGIHADRERVAAWCEQKAAEAQREAADCEDSRDRLHGAGRASAFRAVAGALRGTP
jgi:hypothetical protein